MTYNRNKVPVRTQTFDVYCRCHCVTKFTVPERAKVIGDFTNLSSHDMQNQYLRGCASVIPPTKIRRSRNEMPGTERSSYQYSITLSEKPVKVRKAAFLGLHGIKESRLKGKVLDFSQESIEDGRGKHDGHPSVLREVRQRVREHIRKFAARESHYSRSKNAEKT